MNHLMKRQSSLDSYLGCLVAIMFFSDEVDIFTLIRPTDISM